MKRALTYLGLALGSLSVSACFLSAPVDAGSDSGRDGGTDASADGGGDASVDGGNDASADGGTDASVDGGTDAGVDGGTDAGIDGGHDAGSLDGGPSDPVWEPWLSASDSCVVERARYPERLQGYEWAPCPEQPVGCLEYVGSYPAPYTSTSTSAYFDDGRGRGYRSQRYSGGSSVTRPTVIMLMPTEGPPLAAWRTPPTSDCDLRLNLGVGAGYAGLLVRFSDPDEPARSFTRVYRGSLEEIGSVTEPLASITFLRPLWAMVLSSELLVFFGGDDIYAIDNEGRQYLMNREPPGLTRDAQVVGSHVLWGRFEPPDPLLLHQSLHARPGTTASVFRAAPPAQVVSLLTDGVEMAWLEGYSSRDSTFWRLELWAAPYVSDPVAIEPRLVRVMEPDYEGHLAAYGDGLYAMPGWEPGRLDVVDTSDGTMRRWTTGSCVASGNPLYVSAREILFRNPDGRMIRVDPMMLPLVE